MRTGTRFRGLFISIAVLALSASVVFAGQALPSAAQPGLDRASQEAGFDVPVRAGNEPEVDEVVEPAPDGSIEDGDGSETIDAEETALEVEAQEAWDNHGAMVSEAAQMATPEGFRNHGHFVSCVAHMDHEQDPEAEPLDLASLTPEDCEEDGEEVDEEADDPDEELDEEPLEEVEAAWDNHGHLVSTAARTETPAGFRNHGHFVSCVAHMKDLDAAPADVATLTPEDCDEAQAAAVEEVAEDDSTDAEAEADKGKGKGKARDNGKGKNKDKHENKGKGGRGKGRNR